MFAQMHSESENPGVRLCVCIALTGRELHQLDLVFAIWHQLSRTPNRALQTVDLVLTFPGEENSELYHQAIRSSRIYEIHQVFRRIRIIFLGISSHEDIYIRPDQIEHYTGEIPAYGLKSGPNVQFFESMRRLCDYSHTLLYETDMFAFEGNWLDRVHNVIVSNRGKWVIGATYTGLTRLSVDILTHINGAAIYATGSQDFQEFLADQWMPILAEACKIEPDTAYDILWSRLAAWAISKKIKPKMAIERALKIVHERIVPSNVIINISLPTDPPMGYGDFELAVRNGSAIVHSKNSGVSALLYAMRLANNTALPIVQYVRLALHASKFPHFKNLKTVQLKGHTQELLEHSERKRPVKNYQPIPELQHQGAKPQVELAMTSPAKSLMSWRFPKNKLCSILESSTSAISPNKKFLDLKFHHTSSNNNPIWDFLIHEELLQRRLFEDYSLHGQICQGSYRKPVSEVINFYHVLSIDLRRDSAEYSSSVNIFLDRGGDVYLLVSSGQSHERLFWNISNRQSYSLNPPSEHITGLTIYALNILSESSTEVIDTAYPSSPDIWVNNTINGVSITPIANRPFLAINDYLIVLDKLCKSGIGKATFLPSFFTFIDYRKLAPELRHMEFVSDCSPNVLVNSGDSFKSAVGDHLNQNLLSSRFLHCIPLSISSTDSSWSSTQLYAQRSLFRTTELWNAQASSLPLSDFPLASQYICKFDSRIPEEHIGILFDVSAEKRSCLDQVSAYAYALDVLSSKYATREDVPSLIFFDGYTISNSSKDPYASSMYALLMETVEKIFGELELRHGQSKFCKQIRFLPLFGMEFLDKCFFYQNLSYFIVQVGTASLGVSKCFKRFGRLIGPPAVLLKSSPAFQDVSSCIMTDHLQSIPSDVDANKDWDFQSYHILNYEQLISSDLSVAFSNND